MANETFEKAKDATQKILESETADKVKSTVQNVSGKIKENGTVTDTVAKVNNCKYSKFIKIGLVALIAILVFNIFGGSSKPEKFLKETIKVMYGGNRVKISAVDTIKSDKSKDLYLIDATVKSGDIKTKRFYLIYFDGENGDYITDFEYYGKNAFEKEKHNKSEVKEEAIGFMEEYN